MNNKSLRTGLKGIKYQERLKHHRNRKKPFLSIFAAWTSSDLSLIKKFRFTIGRLHVMSVFLKEIIYDVYTYGSIRKNLYGTSIATQFFQQVYMQFILGVPSENYRVYLLFKKDRWKMVREFTYKNEDLDKDFLAVAIPESIGNYYDHDPTHDKLKFYDHCIKHNIPTPEILALINLNEDHEISSAHFNLLKEDIFIKSINGSCGLGTSKFYYQNNKFVDIHGNSYEKEDVINILNKNEYSADVNLKRKGELIVQPVIENHDSWKPYTSGGLASCRILTARSLNTRKIIPISAGLKMPTGDAVTDNFASGSLASPINLNTGEMGTAISWEPINESFEFGSHPDTGQKIKGTVLPHWDQLLEFTSLVHKTIDFVFVGWDVTYTTRGFMVLEGNGIHAIQMLESVHNLPMSETKYPEIFDQWVYHFSNKGNGHANDLTKSLHERGITSEESITR